MSNLLTRIKDIIIADLNETVERKENQNPIALLNQYLRQCEKETEKVGKLVERQSQLKEEFEKEYKQAHELAEKRKYQAEIATQGGESELSQFAQAEYQQYSNRAQRLQVSLTQVSEQLHQLQRKHEEMKHKVKDMHLRRMELMGRENMTRANLKVNQVLDDANNSSNQSYSRFKDIEGYLDRLEEKVNQAFNQSTIDSRILELEKEMNKKVEMKKVIE